MRIVAGLTPPQSRPTTEKDGEELRSATRARHEVDGYELSAMSYQLSAITYLHSPRSGRVSAMSSQQPCRGLSGNIKS